MLSPSKAHLITCKHQTDRKCEGKSRAKATKIQLGFSLLHSLFMFSLLLAYVSSSLLLSATMTVEVCIEGTNMADVVTVDPKEENEKVANVIEKVVQGDDMVKDVDESKPQWKRAPFYEKSSSYREESNFLFDLKEFERKELNELKEKLEEAICGNNLYKEESPKNTNEKLVAEEKEAKKEGDEKENTAQESNCAYHLFI
ncbi:Patellin-4 [Morella rubra]|uniref:Patellin-4 n=1 Tax=Morella rubra TaxID=262757 RepID=A0A6A1W7E6_9ROSI|nr:Patellin-4 [Morella rubra]